MQGKRLAIEGNIGVGKSTIMPKLAALLPGDWIVKTERVDEDPEFQRLLAAFYKDPNQRIQLQHWLTQRRLEEFKALDPTKNYILERSFLGDVVFCHANMLRHERPDGQYISYYYDILDAAQQCSYDAVVYLRATPERCHNTMASRAREAESCVPLSYLTHLHNCYETFLPESAGHFNASIVNIDWEAFGEAEHVALSVKKALTPDVELAS